MRRVEWAHAVLADIRLQITHIAADNPQAARRVAFALAAAGDSLANFATGLPGRVAGTYEKSVRGLPYIIAYALTDGDAAVSILRIIHTSRDWTDDAWPDG